MATHAVSAAWSMAYRTDVGVRLTLVFDERPALPQLRVRGPRKTEFYVPASITDGLHGPTLDVTLPTESVKAQGVYRFAFTEGESTDGIQARLVLHERVPVSLLTGPSPATRMEEPEPRPAPASPARALARAVVRRVPALRRPLLKIRSAARTLRTRA